MQQKKFKGHLIFFLFFNFNSNIVLNSSIEESHTHIYIISVYTFNLIKFNYTGLEKETGREEKQTEKTGEKLKDCNIDTDDRDKNVR